MSHFYGTLQGNRGEGSRCGSKSSGMETYCASWDGAVRCYAYFNEQKNEDWVRIELTMWQGQGQHVLIYDGPIGGLDATKINPEIVKAASGVPYAG